MQSLSNSKARILPDICVLIAHTLSRLIKLGFLENFEIMIPDFIEDVVERLCDDSSKTGFFIEIDYLRQLG